MPNDLADSDLDHLLSAFADEVSPACRQGMEFTARLLLVQAVRDIVGETRRITSVLCRIHSKT